MLQKLFTQLKLWLAGMPKYLVPFIDDALAFTTRLKAVLQNPVAAVVLDTVLPGADERLKAIVTAAVETLSIAEDVKKATTLEDKLDAFAADIKKYDPAAQNMWLFKLASTIVKLLDDKRLAESMYDLYTQLHYTNSVQKPA